jgi:kinetochore protein NDC80
MIPRVGRENMVPPSPGLTAPTQASRRRSVAPGDRRQTMGGNTAASAASSPTRGGGAVVRTDSRPIHDKAFQQECIKKLLNFLLQNGYEYPVSQKSLARPSGKDFTNIVTFMLRQIDPEFQEHGAKDSIVMKLEDEVAMDFKALGYPFPISKTALVAAGSPHTWPTLLAALTWLMELLEILQQDNDEEINIQDAKPFESLDELAVTTDKVFFAYLSKAYLAFLSGDEARTQQLENALADRFDRDDGYIEQEIERITDLNAAMVEKMNALLEESKE